MSRSDILQWLKHGAKIAGVNGAVFLALFVLVELGLHLKSADQNPLLGPPFVKSAIRVHVPVYSHSLAANFDGEDQWGGNRYHIRTNDLGFKDALNRAAPLKSDRRRVLFIGDSFTEGVALPYEQTFVGRFAAAFPDIDVLNAGVSSYAPSVYFMKIKSLLDAGLQFDEVIVYVDISDVQDEAIYYRYGPDGKLEWTNFEKECPSPEATLVIEPSWWARPSYILEYLEKDRIMRRAIKDVRRLSGAELVKAGMIYGPDRDRGSWTYDPKAKCYGAMGIEGGVAKAIENMDRLHTLLSARGIPLSVGVYPWPQQLLYDQENSRQAQIWRDWCAGKCQKFFDHFPVFFAYKNAHLNFLKDLFIWTDVHYNERGNDLLAQDLIANYR
ncbi:SGNH/GDSL hydrolase family protein [Methylocystis sp. L43]|uniref:SGNH/GDSL hydrolase family protein n=1 Tax=unclassified Methylocystis TaxID=2625913 RepID=UPI0018C2E190|nr:MULTISPECIES: SGNH/GDSL hydrolase family protein [unclassified Methylocystis]MBG0799172.1 SGNH/GDSL hydrolase family protein [Methylocystis sp. L43]MBG0806452.1 SGNH/GDSL hydrolase family protein [Methylocystis sp. H15]